jgi:hypothetical protein
LEYLEFPDEQLWVQLEDIGESKPAPRRWEWISPRLRERLGDRNGSECWVRYAAWRLIHGFGPSFTMHDFTGVVVA